MPEIGEGATCNGAVQRRELNLRFDLGQGASEQDAKKTLANIKGRASNLSDGECSMELEQADGVAAVVSLTVSDDSLSFERSTFLMSTPGNVRFMIDDGVPIDVGDEVDSLDATPAPSPATEGLPAMIIDASEVTYTSVCAQPRNPLSPQLCVAFTQETRENLAAFTLGNSGLRLYVLVDGVVVLRNAIEGTLIDDLIIIGGRGTSHDEMWIDACDFFLATGGLPDTMMVTVI